VSKPLSGFEVELLGAIAYGFKFKDAPLASMTLEVNRHLFAQDAPSLEQLQDLHEDYDPEVEPIISFYTTQGQGVQPSSSRGGRAEWNLKINLRAGAVFEDAKGLLEQLVAFLDRLRGRRLAGFLLKGVIMVSRPTPFTRAIDDGAVSQASVKLMAVPVPTR